MAALMWFAGVLLFGYSCCCYLPYRYLVGFEWPRLRQLLYFPLAGQLRWEHATQRALLLRRLGAEEVSLTTSDERAVHAVWAEPQGQNAGGGGGGNNGEGARPVVLLLHANAMVLDDMTDWAQYYLSLGCAVLVLTFWGYPDPAEEPAASTHFREGLEHAAYSERPDAPGSPDAREAGARRRRVERPL
ncbi:hypothetical protein EMIHUDRAFT_201940 [Emiliania huxleyi CCMP1516]|uniref:Uncharacterized protein n=2 Tax=Emiliania huxleyi TaxID=2903 RepID=A0A0D3KES0_EMIH1|nr:hypothetical protein EMIHUDRAFT_241578 [Emiliania huxleyi CCMP1516]XP_005786684.1 hypothetical protein EMIHUDRAFT_201940 [Emiliania huxleyi CCMP1516]EOD21175.1 hypothetical protein EMIHUDRAFT_241578 [Emiliania huxleyi CCMP1516]EOD34255.1 hypothetical protein EMIHUDRAFT_201940 [Emiliania huxleyi CCMP1516]|eukprot:XP_005773604.1 hypothetical protein EMIHUDRAFT_241578 [Emiliania huxleyi CCMP1516]